MQLLGLRYKSLCFFSKAGNYQSVNNIYTDINTVKPVVFHFKQNTSRQA
jgi:hypothetical protein